MILGVYWSNSIPEKLYKYSFFKFSKAIGGFDDRPATLQTSIFVLNPEKIINQIRELHKKHNECSIFIKRKDNKLTIGTSNYELYDYDFLVIKEIEGILKKSWFVFKISEFHSYDRENQIILKSINENKENTQNKNFKIFHNTRDKYSSVLKSLNINCYLKSNIKEDFIRELKQIVISENLKFMYHFDFSKEDLTNLIVAISNGRQGLKLESRNNTSIESFEVKTNILFEKFNVTFDYIDGFNMDVLNGITIELINGNEKDFLLDSGSKIKNSC